MATATEKLAALAVAVSTEAPLRLKPPGYQVYITHETVKRIRAVLDEARIDWRQLHKNARTRGEAQPPQPKRKCGDGNCSKYRNMNGGCDVCGAPCI